MNQGITDRIRSGLTENMASTAPDAADERLRGRTYAVTFSRVWQAAIGVVEGELERWKLTGHDDNEGVIRAVACGRIQRYRSAITIRIFLDTDGQTRVDVRSISPDARGDLGLNRRRIRRFLRTLDAALADSGGGRPARNGAAPR